MDYPPLLVLEGVFSARLDSLIRVVFMRWQASSWAMQCHRIRGEDWARDQYLLYWRFAKYHGWRSQCRAVFLTVKRYLVISENALPSNLSKKTTIRRWNMFFENFFSDPLNPFICDLCHIKTKPSSPLVQWWYGKPFANVIGCVYKRSWEVIAISFSALTISMTESKSKTGKAIEIDPRVGQLGNQDKKVRTASAWWYPSYCIMSGCERQIMDWLAWRVWCTRSLPWI